MHAREYLCIYIYYTHTHTHTYIYIHVLIYMFKYAGLEIGGVASQNENHFWVNCESLGQSDSQYYESLLSDLRITLMVIITQFPFF